MTNSQIGAHTGLGQFQSTFSPFFENTLFHACISCFQQLERLAPNLIGYTYRLSMAMPQTL